MNPHAKDSDCTEFDGGGCCVVCGVLPSSPCPTCGGSSYHVDGCTEMDELPDSEYDYEEQHEDTDSLEDRGIFLGSYAS